MHALAVGDYLHTREFTLQQPLEALGHHGEIRDQ
jgi:hypothetical protein